MQLKDDKLMRNITEEAIVFTSGVSLTMLALDLE